MDIRRMIVGFSTVLLLLVVHVGNGRGGGGIGPGLACPNELVGTWSGGFAAADLLSLEITITNPSPNLYRARIAGAGRVEEEIAVSIDGDRIRFQSAMFPISFDGRRSPSDNTIDGFLHYTSFLTHVQLQLRGDQSSWETSWTPLGVMGESFPIDLRVVYEDDNSIAGYLFFREERLPRFWTYGLQCDDGAIQFRDKNFGLAFEGGFDREADLLKMIVSVNGGSRPMTFARLSDDPNFETSSPEAFDRTYSGSAPDMIGDGWNTATPASEGVDGGKIGEMVVAISSGELTLTHSVLIVRHGLLVVEEYFHGFDRDTWHDTRSASKTLASAFIGLAIDYGRIANVDVRALDFFPQYRRFANWDERKTRIKIRHLLTMSSGLDANDGDPESVASENAYQSQTARPDWVKFVLDAPMIEEPGARLLYGSGN
ncbi:MAG: serine hydrolase, partial [Gemmatimonadota bacterium]